MQTQDLINKWAIDLKESKQEEFRKDIERFSYDVHNEKSLKIFALEKENILLKTDINAMSMSKSSVDLLILSDAYRRVVAENESLKKQLSSKDVDEDDWEITEADSTVLLGRLLGWNGKEIFRPYRIHQIRYGDKFFTVGDETNLGIIVRISIEDNFPLLTIRVCGRELDFGRKSLYFIHKLPSCTSSSKATSR